MLKRSLLFLIPFLLSYCTSPDPGIDPPAVPATGRLTDPPEASFSPNPTVIIEDSHAYSSPTVAPTSAKTATTLGASTPAQDFAICSPLASASIAELPLIVSAPYNPPPLGQEGRHQGVDFSYWRRGERASIEGDTIQAALAGRVVGALPERMPYGNTVIIETPGANLPPALAEEIGREPGESLYSLYAHMRLGPTLMLGEWITACGQLGEVGKSGNAGVAHLHLEMRLGPEGQTFESMAYYQDDASEEERANYLLWRTSKTFRHFDPMILLLFELGDF